jgi:hypothetical protein
MASLDDVLDISERLDRSNIDYVILTLQKGKTKYKSDIFIGLEDKESIEIMGLLIESVYAHINDKDFLKKNKKVKKPRKKPPDKPPENPP